MKFFPIKIAILCMLVTPFLSIVTVTSYENYLNNSYSYQIQNILIGDSKDILEGSVRLEEQIATNIQNFLTKDWMVQKTGLDIKILVTTNHKKIIYPIYLDVDSLARDINAGFDSETIARNNFDSLNSGLVVEIETNLTHGSNIGYIILALYIGVSFFIFLRFYKIGKSKANVEGEQKKELIKNLKKEEKIYKQILNDLEKDRQGLFENIKALNTRHQKDKKKAEINEEELFGEIISLEEKLSSFMELKQNKEIEISELKSKINKYERRKGSKNKRIEFDFMIKRFCALYKNIVINRKALSGFLVLSDEQQIKAEEVIHLMDQNPDKITIKRKVFSGKKHRTACFEVLFAYNGRLYFKKNENSITEILVIGTKNSQTKDMEFLHSL